MMIPADPLQIRKRNCQSRPLRLALLASLILMISSSAIIRANDDLLQLKKQWAIEAGSAEMNQVRAKSYRILSQGLKYAASKLCPGDPRKKLLESHDQLIAKLKSMAKSKEKISQALSSTAKHLVNAQKFSANPSRRRLELSLAKDELDLASDHNRDQSRMLKKAYGEIIRSEVQYQQVLADCLLGDFMSIFGDDAPMPEPDVPDDFPDESQDPFFQDDRLGGFDDPGFRDPDFDPSDFEHFE